jgi:hypothetical protein
VVDARKEGFTFLGFELRMGISKRTGNKYPHVRPSRKSLQKIKDRKIKDHVTELTRRGRTLIPLPALVGQVNDAVRGWVGYFHYRNCAKTLLHLRGHVEQRLRTHLCKRHKVRNTAAGYARFPNRSLYEKYGLYKVPTTAGWTRAHAVR